MNQTTQGLARFHLIGRGLRYILLGLMILIALYAVGRLIHVGVGSFYSGSRGPYLQMASDTAMTIRWQSLDEYVGGVRFGQSLADLDRQRNETVATDRHEVRLSGLQPMTKYYYRLVGSESPLGETYQFTTSASAGAEMPVRLWVTGDQGYRGSIQSDVKSSAWRWLQQNVRPERAPLDLWLTTGDNAYRSGSNQDFQDNFFEPYAELLSMVPVWPAYGNHDARRWAFFDIFSLPTNAESGGTASHTEHYYSFDYGLLHVIMLDSQASDLSPNGKMARWLRADLKASDLPWRIVVLHHPPYTRGSHNSDRLDDSGGRLFAVRENLLPILERHGVDLVLSGHSHMYERTHAIACHYQTSDKWQTKYVRDGSSPYTKGSGTVYAVVGSSSKLDNGPLDHPANPVSVHEAGSMVIDVTANQLVSRFINRDGFISDQFDIVIPSDTSTKDPLNCE